jgi:hypothetical protein
MIPYLDDLARAQGGAIGANVTSSGSVAGAPSGDFFTSPDEKVLAMRWLVGIGGTWIILTVMVDLGITAELAVAFALVIMGSVLFAYGPGVFSSIGFLNPPKTQGG